MLTRAMTPKFFSRFYPKIIWFLIPVVFSSFFLFWKLGENHLIEFDEGIYAVVAKNMARHGDFLNMTITGASPWLEKPPLYFWLSALSIKLFGLNSFSPRLPAALFGIGTVVLTAILGGLLFNKRAGFTAAIILSSTVGFLYYGRLGMLDVALTFFMTGALLFYWLGRKDYKYFLLMGIFFGLAFMTKNLIALLGLLIVLLFSLYERKFYREKYIDRLFLAGLFLALFLPAPWYVYMYLKYGPTFLDVFFLYHTFGRVGTVLEGEGAPLFWYITVIRTQFRIWFVLLFPALAWSVKRIREGSREYLFVLFTASVIFCGFSAASSKLMWFILPVYPFLALLVGVFVDWFLSQFSPVAGRTLLVVFLVISFLYNVDKLDKIISPDFNRDFVEGVKAADRLNGDKELLVFENYYVANYYNLRGSVSMSTVSEIPEWTKNSTPVYLLVKSSVIPRKMELEKYVKVVGHYNDYLLLEKF